MECFNQKVKIRLQLYVNHLQDNWICWLLIIEFTNNNAVNKSIKMTSFYLNKDFSLHIFFSSDITKTATVQEKLQICSAIEITKTMNRILSVTHDNLTKTQNDIIKQVNCWCCLENFTVENEIIINTQNLISDWSTKTLDDKRYKLFRILQQFHFFYKLDISFEWYTTNIFHVSNLTRATKPKQPPLTEQRNPLLKPAVINNKNQTEWVLEKILNSWYLRSDCHLQYKIHWSDYNPNPIWYNTDSNEFQNISEILHEYHMQYLNKPDLQLIELKLIHHQSTKADWKEIKNVILKVIPNSLLLPYWI